MSKVYECLHYDKISGTDFTVLVKSNREIRA